MPADNSLPNMGFAQYCMNCHASAANNLTFASPKNMQGEPGEPLTFLSGTSLRRHLPLDDWLCCRAMLNRVSATSMHLMPAIAALRAISYAEL